MSQKRSNPRPPSWARYVYRLLAAGRYATEWLPDLLELYEHMHREQGGEVANAWLLTELAESIEPAVELKLMWVLKIALVIFRIYRMTARK